MGKGILVLFIAVLIASLSACGGDDEKEASTSWPAAGEDNFESTTATVEIQISQEGAAAAGIRLQETETVELQGPARVTRSDPELDGDVYVVTTEIVEMELTGTASFGNLTVHQSPDRPSTGEVRQSEPGKDSDAESFFDVFVEVEVGSAMASTGSMQGEPLVLHNEDALHMEATLSGLPPGEGDAYMGEDERPLFTPAGLEVGKIIDALHIPVPEGGEAPTEAPTEPGAEPSATEPMGGGEVKAQMALGCQHRGPGDSLFLIAVFIALRSGTPLPSATVDVSADGPGLLESSGSATTNAQGVAQVPLGINQFGTYSGMIDQVTLADGTVAALSPDSTTTQTFEVGEECMPPSFD